MKIRTYSEATGRTTPDRVQKPESLPAPRMGGVPGGGGEAGGMIANAGRQLQGVSGELLQRAKVLKEEDDAVAVFKAYNEAADRERDYLTNPETGQFVLTGEASKGAVNRGKEFYGTVEREYAETLENENQKQLFNMKWKNRREVGLNGLAKHEAGQRVEYKKNEQMAVLESAVQDAIARCNDPAAIAVALADAEGAVKALNVGQSEEVIAAGLREARSKVHAGVVAGLAVNTPGKAQQYLMAHKGAMEADEAVKLEAALKSKLEAEAVDWTVAGLINSNGGDLEAALDQAADPEKLKNLKPSQRHQVLQQLDYQVKVGRAQDAREREDYARTTTNKLWNAFRENKLTPSMIDATELDVPAKEHFHDLVLAGDKSLSRTDPAVRAQVRIDMEDGRVRNKQYFWSKVGKGLSIGEAEKLAKEWEKGSEAGTYGGDLNPVKLIKNRFITEFDPDDRQLDTFLMVLAEERGVVEEKLNRTLTHKEMMDLGLELMGKVEDGWFSDTYRYEELYQERFGQAEKAIEEVDYEPIPAEAQEKIARALEAQGKPASAANIRAVYEKNKDKF